MRNSGASAQLQNETSKEKLTGFDKFKSVVKKINSVINTIGMTLFHLRKIVLAAPVVYYALKLADYNRTNLPEQVGLNLQSTGEFTHMITRDMAVMGPLALTAACLLLMFCSRKASYAWAISVFTLVLPLLLLISNVYPA